HLVGPDAYSLRHPTDRRADIRISTVADRAQRKVELVPACGDRRARHAVGAGGRACRSAGVFDGHGDGFAVSQIRPRFVGLRVVAAALDAKTATGEDANAHWLSRVWPGRNAPRL